MGGVWCGTCLVLAAVWGFSAEDSLEDAAAVGKAWSDAVYKSALQRCSSGG